MDKHSILAQILIKLDKNLNTKREKLVPDLIEEEDFWRNYFFKIDRFKQSLGLTEEQEDLENTSIQMTLTGPSQPQSTTEQNQQPQKPKKAIKLKGGHTVSIP